VISNFDGDSAGGGQDTVDLDALFDSLSIAGPDRAGRVTLTPGVGAVDVSVDVSALHDGSNVITVATLNTTRRHHGRPGRARRHITRVP